MLYTKTAGSYSIIQTIPSGPSTKHPMDDPNHQATQSRRQHNQPHRLSNHGEALELPERHSPAILTASSHHILLRKVNSAIPDLSRCPLPMDTILSYCCFVAVARGRFRDTSFTNASAMPESLAACSAEK